MTNYNYIISDSNIATSDVSTIPAIILNHGRIRANHQKIDDEGMKAIFSFIENGRYFHTFELVNNNISPEGRTALFDGLKQASFLSTLILSEKSFDRKNVKALADALKINTSLHSVGYGDNQLFSSKAKIYLLPTIG